MRKYFKFVCMTGLLFSLFMLSACGGGGRADAEYEGKYISVAAEAIGVTLTGDDVSGFGLELNSNGKGKMSVEGESHSIKWTNDDENITVSLEGTDMIGAIGKDTIVFNNLLDAGIKVTFAKEGSEAAKRENNLPETEKKMLGVWQSNKVTDVLGDPVDGLSGNEMKLDFSADHTAKVTFKEKTLENQKWQMLSEWGYFEGENPKISWKVTENRIDVTYSSGDDYFIFECTKQQ